MAFVRTLALLLTLNMLSSGLLPPRMAFAAEDAVYLAAVADLPLMPGLQELADAGIVFDKPAGRIVEAYAAGQVSGVEVLEFYSETLPELGWQAQDAQSFRREGEKLELELLEGEGLLTVHFTLAPD